MKGKNIILSGLIILSLLAVTSTFVSAACKIPTLNVTLTNLQDSEVTDTVTWEVNASGSSSFVDYTSDCEEDQQLTLASDEQATVSCTSWELPPRQTGEHVARISWGGTTNEFTYGQPEARIKILTVPVNTGDPSYSSEDQGLFESNIKGLIDDFFIRTNIQNCMEDLGYEYMNMQTEYYNAQSCSEIFSSSPIISHVNSQGYNAADYDMIIAIVNPQDNPCEVTGGAKGSFLGDGVMWAIPAGHTVAHEIGHYFGLDEEYCSQEATPASTESWCNSPSSPNRLQPSLGCDPKPTASDLCCNFDAIHQCSDTLSCCKGNVADGGRCIMAAGTALNEPTGGFCDACISHLDSQSMLQCS